MNKSFISSSPNKQVKITPAAKKAWLPLGRAKSARPLPKTLGNTL